MPSDTEQTNPALVIPRGSSLPKFSQFEPRHCIRAVVKRTLEMEALIDELDMKYEEDGKLSDLKFDELFADIETHLVAANYQTQLVSLLQENMRSKYGWRYNFNVGLQRAANKRHTSRALFEYMSSFDQQRTNLNRFQQRVVDKYLLEGRLNGLSLDSDQSDGLDGILQKLQTHRATFRKNVDSTFSDPFKALILDAKLLNALPDGHVSALSSAPPTAPPPMPAGVSKWRARAMMEASVKPSAERSALIAAEYQEFMENCDDRDSRQRMFVMYNNRAFKSQQNTNNSVVIEEIRTHRKIQANTLGFDSYADMSMETKMAGSLDVVKSMINMLHNQNQSQVDSDLAELKGVAAANLDQLDQIELWDIDFYRRMHSRQLRESKTSDGAVARELTDEHLSLYFPIERVLKGLFNFATRVFQVHIEEVPRSSFDSWHSADVRLFRLVSPNGSTGSLYFDPWARSDDKINSPTHKNYTSMSVLLSRSAICDTQPIMCLSLDLPRPLLKDHQINLSFQDVVRLSKGVSLCFVMLC